METEDVRIEWLKCAQSSAYFVHNYCKIYDATAREWIPFHLWPKQADVLDELEHKLLIVALKARQLGMTWLVLCYILWRMLFHPAFTALVFSRREVEAIYLLSTSRLRGVYGRLPSWMQVRQIITDSSHVWQLSNGSVCYGFPTSAGDSYTAGFAFVDEADLVPDLDRLMNAVKPTIDGGGQMVLLSRVDKSTPSSLFKRTYVAARKGGSGWTPIFLPWYTRPERTQAWYGAQKADILSRTTALDDLYQQYPATDSEALLPPTLNRRIPFTFLSERFVAQVPLEVDSTFPDVPFLTVYCKPQYGVEYVIPADPAEGNPTSDDSVAYVFNEFGEECANIAGKIEPGVFASYLAELSNWYNNAKILPERNNHGHAVILALDTTHEMDVMLGWDDKPGWMSSSRGKALMYSTFVQTLRDGDVTLHTQEALDQLASIEGATLRAPEGQLDDHATTCALGAVALKGIGVLVQVGESLDANYRG